MRTVRNEVKKETDYFIFEQNIYLKKKLKKKLNNFLPFSLSSSLGGKKKHFYKSKENKSSKTKYAHNYLHAFMIMGWCCHLFRFPVLKSYNQVRTDLSGSLSNSAA